MALVPSLSEARFAWSPPEGTAIQPSPGFAPINWSPRTEIPKVDDLNRITLEATCEVLPLCRDRNVTLLVRLASESMRIRIDSRLLGRAVYDLLKAASSCAQLNGGYGRLLVSTSRRGAWAEFCVSASSAQGRDRHFDEILPTTRDVVEAFGGTLRVTTSSDQTTFVAALPLDDPGAPQLEQRIEPLQQGMRDDQAIAGDHDEWSRENDGDPDRASQWPVDPGALARGHLTRRGIAHL